MRHNSQVTFTIQRKSCSSNSIKALDLVVYLDSQQFKLMVMTDKKSEGTWRKEKTYTREQYVIHCLVWLEQYGRGLDYTRFMYIYLWSEIYDTHTPLWCKIETVCINTSMGVLSMNAKRIFNPPPFQYIIPPYTLYINWRMAAVDTNPTSKTMHWFHQWKFNENFHNQNV